MVGIGEPGDPLGCRGELDAVVGLTGPDRDAGGQVWAIRSRINPRAWP